MKTPKILTILVVFLGLVTLMATVARAEPMGSAFTYQGRLMDANNPADGLYDLQFKLYDANVAGTQKGSTISVNELDVVDGSFIVYLDFGSDPNIFNGDARWLDIGVRPGELGDPNLYTSLSPRQLIAPAPYALYAKTAGSGGGGGADSDWIISGNNMYSGVSGNVGIGTSSPAAKLDVSGDISTTSVYKIGGSTVLSIAGTENTFIGVYAGASNSGSYNTFMGYGAGYFNTTGVHNTFSGLQAGYANTTGAGNVFLGYQAGYNETGDNKLYIANSDTTVPLIYGDFSTGNVGIGTTSPATKLDVVGDGEAVVRGFNVGTGNSGILGGSEAGVIGRYGGGRFQGGLADNECGAWGENFATGAVGEIANDFSGVYAQGGTGSVGLHAQYNDSNNCYWAELGCRDYAGIFGGDVRIVGKTTIFDMPVFSSGQLVCAQVGPSGWTLGFVGSSARFKENIKPLKDDFHKILQVTPKSFAYKSNGDNDIGFIAEDFNALGLKNLVHYQDSQPFSIKYEKIPLYLLEVMKDQANAIEALRAENELLKQRLETLERKIVQYPFAAVAREVQQ